MYIIFPFQNLRSFWSYNLSKDLWERELCAVSAIDDDEEPTFHPKPFILARLYYTYANHSIRMLLSPSAHSQIPQISAKWECGYTTGPVQALDVLSEPHLFLCEPSFLYPNQQRTYQVPPFSTVSLNEGPWVHEANHVRSLHSSRNSSWSGRFLSIRSEILTARPTLPEGSWLS